jgi:hypothetical protein
MALDYSGSGCESAAVSGFTPAMSLLIFKNQQESMASDCGWIFAP